MLVGCGPSKEEAALAHVRSIKKPGAVRLVNLSDDSVLLKIDGVVVTNEVPPRQGTIYIVGKAGQRKVSVTSSSGEALAETSWESKPLEGMSLFLVGKGDCRLLGGEPRERTKDSAPKLAVVNTAKGATEVTAAGAVVAPSVPAGSLFTVQDPKAGKFSFEISLGGKKALVDGELQVGRSYSLVILEKAGKPQGVLLENSPADPAMTGASGAG